MAEVFGVAAGVFGVVSLSIQLAESVRKVKGFCENVKNAPSRLANLVDEIGEMCDLIKELEQQQQSNGVVASPLMLRCIESPRKAVEYFSTLSSELEARMKRRKKIGSVSFALSQDDVDRMLNKVERAKSLPALAYMQYQVAVQQQQHESVLQVLQDLSSGQTAVLQMAKPAATGLEPVTQDRAVVSNRDRVTARSQTLLGARRPSWLGNTIWQFELQRSISGWQFTMRTYGIVSIYAPVFEACRTGDITCMQRLFDERRASPFDRTEDGFSLWEYGLNGGDDASASRVLRFLLGCGVVPDSLVRAYGMILHWALLYECRYATFRDDVLMLRDYDEMKSEYDLHRPQPERSAMRLALCSPEEAPYLRFWQSIHRNAWSGIFEPVYPRPFVELLTRHRPEDTGGRPQLHLLATLYPDEPR